MISWEILQIKTESEYSSQSRHTSAFLFFTLFLPANSLPSTDVAAPRSGSGQLEVLEIEWSISRELPAISGNSKPIPCPRKSVPAVGKSPKPGKPLSQLFSAFILLLGISLSTEFKSSIWEDWENPKDLLWNEGCWNFCGWCSHFIVSGLPMAAKSSGERRQCNISDKKGSWIGHTWDWKKRELGSRYYRL